MPPRLAHSKSRNGCLRCKSRKVKCTETRPKCASCLRHGLECVYGPVLPPKRSTGQLSSSTKAAQQVTTSPASTSASTAAYPSPASTTATSASLHSSSSPFLPVAAVSAVSNLFNDASPESSARRLLELRLMSHFLTVVVRTFASTDQPEVLSAWQHRLPALALRFPFLLNAVLATSALHLAVGGTGAGDYIGASSTLTTASEAELANNGDFNNIIGPMTRTDFAAIHQTYFDLALSQHRAAIDQLCTENADAVCMTTVLISNHGFLLGARQGYRTSADLVNDSRADLATVVREYEIPLHWLSLSAGIREVVRYALEKLLTKDSIIRVHMGTFHLQAIEATMKDPRCGQVFSQLLDFTAHPDPADLKPAVNECFASMDGKITVAEVYDRALRYLGHVFLMIERGESQARIARLCMSFTSMVPREFVRLIDQNRPRALVVLTHLFALTIVLEDVWWFRGAAERHVRGLEASIPHEWQWALDWPRRAVRREVWPQYFLSQKEQAG